MFAESQCLETSVSSSVDFSSKSTEEETKVSKRLDYANIYMGT